MNAVGVICRNFVCCREGDELHLVHVIPRMQMAAVYGAPPVDFLPQQDPVAYDQLVKNAESFIAGRFIPSLASLKLQPIVHIVKVTHTKLLSP